MTYAPPSRLRLPSPVVAALCLAPAAIALSACAEDGGGAETFGNATDNADAADAADAPEGTGNADAGATGDGSEASTDGGATGSSGQAEGSSDGGASTSEGSSDDGEPDPPRACDYALGCHMPHSTPANIGSNSDAPVGCEGGVFRPSGSMSVTAIAPQSTAPRTNPLLGDFDGDGDLDLVINARQAGSGYVFKGDGTGDFSQMDYGTLVGGFAFAGGWGGDVGDFNNDGHLDVALGDHTRGALAFSGSGNMSFTATLSGLFMSDRVHFSGAGFGDLNGDGHLDVSFGSDQFSTGWLFYLWNPADSSWTGVVPPNSNTAKSAGHIVFADADGDGDLDAFATSRAGGATSISMFVIVNNLSSGGDMSQILTQRTGGRSGSNGTADPVQGHVGDVNCDGLVDMAVGGSIYLATSAGQWSNNAVAVDDAEISHLADMDGDGHLDLLTHSPTTGLALYLGDGTGSGWTRDTQAGLPDESYKTQGASLVETYGIDVGHLDGNENLDVVRVGGFGNQFIFEAWSR